MEPTPTQPAGTLTRELGLVLLILYGMGTIIGAGIWVLVGEVAGVAGMAAPLAFLVAAGVAALTGASYAALCAELPQAGGEVVYVDAAFGVRLVTGATGWLVTLTGVVSAATIARGFAGYVQVIVPAPEWLSVIVLITGLALVCVRGIRASVTVAAVLTLISVAALLWIIAARTDAELLARAGELVTAVPALGPGWLPVLGAAFVAFYAFIGFEDMVNVAEEARRPARDLPLAIALALAGSALLYAGVAAVAVLAVAPDELAQRAAPLAWVAGRGESDPWIALAGLLSVVNSALAQIIMSARVLLGLARKGLAPARLGAIGGRGTPVPATLLAAGAILVLALVGELSELARLTSGVILVLFVLVNTSLLVLRLRQPERFGLPVLVPVLAILATAGLLAASVQS